MASVPIPVPVSSPRTVSVIGVNGWYSANCRSPAGIEAVVAAAEEIAAREAAMAKALLDGQSVSTVMGANYENMLAVHA